MSRLPLRLQVALAFTATTALVLAALGFVVYRSLESALEDQAWERLSRQLTTLSELPPDDQPPAVAAVEPPAFAQVLTSTGDLEASSPQVTSAAISADQIPAADEMVQLTSAVRLDGENELEQAIVLVRNDGDTVLLVGTSREDVFDTLQTVLVTLLLGCLGALLLAAALGYVVAGTALRPVERMREQASRISAARSGERLPLPESHDEIHRLGLTLNAMLDRLEAGLQRERRFVGEAGHELRTPLALLRMEIDVALSAPRTNDELLDALRSAGEEVDRLIRLSEDLLQLASSGADQAPVHPTLHVRELLAAVAARCEPAFVAAGRTLLVDADPALEVAGDRDRLDRVLTNLVDNALRHGAGDVHLTAEDDPDSVRIQVTDAGDGVPAAVRDTAFEPFTLASTARTTGGNGLGLAIVRSIVVAHGGDVSFSDGDLGGTVVTVSIPKSGS
jgi:signal transduction histidine kinase